MSKTITLTDEQYQALQSGEAITIEPHKKQWEPRGGCYWVDSAGASGVGGGRYDNCRLFGIEFDTREEAEYAAEQYRIYHWMFKAWLEVVGDWRPDWEGLKQAKWYAFYSYRTDSIRVECRYEWQYGHGFYFPTKEKAMQWADMVGHLIKELGV